jgi:MFS family permease
MWNKSLAYIRKFDRNLWVLAGGWFVSALGFAASIPFIAIYFHAEFKLSMTEIGLFFGVLAIVRSMFQAVGGEVSDRIERRWLLIASQFFRSGAFLLMASALHWHWGFWWVAVFLLINSIFGAVFQPAANATVSDILSKEKRLDGYAITRAAGNLGWAAGPAVGGFLAASSYALLFAISSAVTLLSGLIFLLFLKVPQYSRQQDRFKLSDIFSVRNDPYLAWHAGLIFLLYLVVAQMIAPFSVYAVEMIGISKNQLGSLYTLNGLLVVFLQIPITRLLSRFSLTIQLAWGSFLYVIGYSMVGVLIGFRYFILAITIVTIGEMFMSPPTLTLTSRLAPDGRMGRYMGVIGFVMASGWSFGPLYGGVILDHLGGIPSVAWITISSLAFFSAVGYFIFTRRLPAEYNTGH